MPRGSPLFAGNQRVFEALLTAAVVLVLGGCQGNVRDSDEQSSDVQAPTVLSNHAPSVPEDRPPGVSRYETLIGLSPAVDPGEAAQFAEVSNTYAGRFRGVLELEGKGVAFFVDGQLAYPALTCVNPACPAQGKGNGDTPFLFVREFKDVQQGPDGQIIWPADPEITAEPVCPACNQNGTIRTYVLPSTARRMEQLKAELDSARAAHSAARQQGLERAAGVRTPREVMLEMESLKQLYLVPRK